MIGEHGAAHSNRAINKRGLFQPAVCAFSVSLATILLQLVQTRIFGVVYWNHLVYFIVSIALLGFGISGTLLTFHRWQIIQRVLSLRNAAAFFVATALFSSLAVPRLGITMPHLFSAGQQLRLFTTYTFAVLPYFFGGWILGALFRDYAEHMHLLYFSDLVGGALGCLIFVWLVQPLGAVAMIVVCCLFVAAPIFAAHLKSLPGIMLMAGLLAVLGAVFASREQLNRAIEPEPTKGFRWNEVREDPDDEKIIELSEWNTISRIDVVSSKKHPNTKRCYIDGDAWTEIVANPPDIPPPWQPDSERMLGQALVYLLHKNYDESLVIGSGGGIDVWQALRAGARHIDAVEINPTTWRIGLHEYRQANNNLFHRPGVVAWNEEGRSFVRRSKKLYDIIMLKGVDTFAAINAGAYMLSENYLYTVDGLKDYISHLKPDGTLCILRWRHPAESPRLFIVALEALYELGVAEPEKCIIATAKLNRVAVMVQNTPFAEKDLDKIRRHAARFEDGRVFFPPAGAPNAPAAPPPEEAEEANVYPAYAAARRENRQQEFFKAFPYSISPVWDDSPFFFHYEKIQNIPALFKSYWNANPIRGVWPSLTLFALFAFTGVAVALFMLLPLTAHGAVHIPRFKSWLAYFTCLGVAFIFIEIALMQRFALLLGHPARSLALVLGALLFFAGVGSYTSDRFRTRLPLVLGLLVCFILAAAFVYPALVRGVLGWPLAGRALVTLALIMPLGILMGMPFPSGIRKISTHGAAAVPWMWGVNGGSTVLGSILAIFLAVHLNFTTVLLLAALGYSIALGLSTYLLRSP